jgi:disease resistance protein
METKLKCMRPGCGKDYTETENNDKACYFHPGKPIFHDIKKGWTCCNKIVYDWDEFTKLVGCEISNHTNVKQDAGFFKSSTVDNAQKGIERSEQAEQVKIKSIDEHEKEVKRLEEEKKKLEADKPKEILVNLI